MLGLQSPASRVHSHHSSQQQHQYQPPQARQTYLQRLQDEKRLAIASASGGRQHQAPGPTPLSRVWSADQDMADEAPSPQSSPCPPSRVNDREGRSLFERISFKKPPPTDSKAARDYDSQEHGPWGGQNRIASRDFSPAWKPFPYLEDDAQISKAESAFNSNEWSAAKGSTKSPPLFLNAHVMTANTPTPTLSTGLGRTDVDMDEYVQPSTVSEPPASWPATTQIRQQPINMGVKSENKPAPLNFGSGNNIKAPPLSPASLTAFRPSASAVWKTPTTAPFVKPSRAPLPLSTSSTSTSISIAAWSSPNVQMMTPAPTSHPRFSFSTSTNQLQHQASHVRYSSPFQVMSPPHTMSPSRLHHLHIAPTAALNFKPPLPSPPLTVASSRPQLSMSVYLACLAKQEENNGSDAKVMLKCKMTACLQREAITFGWESLGNGMVDRYRRGFGCGGCGEMLEVVVC